MLIYLDFVTSIRKIAVLFNKIEEKKSLPLSVRLQGVVSLTWLVKAGLSEEQVSTWAEPHEELLSQWLQLLITQIHQQPIREDHVKTETESVIEMKWKMEKDIKWDGMHLLRSFLYPMKLKSNNNNLKNLFLLWRNFCRMERFHRC